MVKINEYGEIIRDKDPNEINRENLELSAADILWIILGNIFSFFTVGIFLFFLYKLRGYKERAKQSGATTLICILIVVTIIVITKL
ncbi:hypothetical protein D0T53_00275 [Dysgonomonas sp. 216]|uniref:hypothetical protein n=1 Tax=Dysgonomonas sp. 216 TaxID=2302934 RepID=UPI0013D154EE|nr:hypothetical protein [Dysgonomonas sp. 216]NDW17349.1 hypothetical protein [Dysgonomonas sp. 216]